jgi:hypothetical protein
MVEHNEVVQDFWSLSYSYDELALSWESFTVDRGAGCDKQWAVKPNLTHAQLALSPVPVDSQRAIKNPHISTPGYRNFPHLSL